MGTHSVWPYPSQRTGTRNRCSKVYLLRRRQRGETGLAKRVVAFAGDTGVARIACAAGPTPNSTVAAAALAVGINAEAENSGTTSMLAPHTRAGNTAVQ